MDRRIFDFDQEEIAENGKRIYTERLKAKLEPDHKGEIAAINTETGDYFLGKTLLEAVRRGREKFPDTVFYSVRIGYPALVKFRGRLP